MLLQLLKALKDHWMLSYSRARVAHLSSFIQSFARTGRSLPCPGFMHFHCRCSCQQNPTQAPKILPLSVTAPAFQASAQTSMPHHFFEQTQSTTKTIARFCQSNGATSRSHQDCRNCESSMASNPHPITPSAGTTTSTRNRRRQHTRTRLDGGHWPPSHPTAASRPALHHQRKEESRNSATEKKKNDNEFHTLQPALSPAGTSLMKRD